MQITPDNDHKKGKRFLIWKCHVTLTRTKAVTFISQNHCSTFILKNQLASFSNQHSISFTHGLQYYKDLGQTGLHRLYGLWQESRQIWTLFFVQK